MPLRPAATKSVFPAAIFSAWPGCTEIISPERRAARAMLRNRAEERKKNFGPDHAFLWEKLWISFWNPV
jgi:hypothetical protein